MIFSASSISAVCHQEIWYPGVRVSYAVIGRNGFPAPLDDCFENVAEADENTRIAVSEFFTWTEASLFKGWMQTKFGVEIETSEITLPISSSMLSLGMTPQIQAFQGMIYFDEHPGWDLLFRVYGVYDLREWDHAANIYTVPAPICVGDDDE